jgi:hypothetical protein
MDPAPARRARPNEFARLANIDKQSPRAVAAAMAITTDACYRGAADVAERLLFVKWLVQAGRLEG